MTADKFKRLGLDRSFMPMGLDELVGAETPPIGVFYGKMQAIEPSITKDMTTIANKVGVNLAGLEYRLKDFKSLERKVIGRMTSGDDLVQVLKDINDVIRYTAILDENDFIEQYQDLQNQLIKQGYRFVRVKNTWRDGQAYKGINAFVEKGGVVFELQFHTKDSFALKNGELHRLYELAREVDTTSEDRKN